jgi:hypothetical protein
VVRLSIQNAINLIVWSLWREPKNVHSKCRAKPRNLIISLA